MFRKDETGLVSCVIHGNVTCHECCVDGTVVNRLRKGGSFFVKTRARAISELTCQGRPLEIVEACIGEDGDKFRLFKNAPKTFREIFETTRSDKPFLQFEDGKGPLDSLTYEQSWRAACDIAHVLVHEFGVKKGDRVAISCRNYPEWILAFMAITCSGAIFVAMNSLWTPKEMEYGLLDSGSLVLFADDERLNRFEKCNIPYKVRLVGIRCKSRRTNVIPFESLIQGQRKNMPSVQLHPDDDVSIMYTSGSTGHPKGVVATHRMVCQAIISWQAEGVILMMLFPSLLPPLEADKVQPSSLLGLPLFHVSGLYVQVLSTFRLGGRILIMYKWDAERAVKLINQYKIARFNGTPAMTGDLVRMSKTHSMPSLVGIGGGGASRSPSQVKEIYEVAKCFPSIGWGMTETQGLGCQNVGPSYIQYPSSSGQVAPILEMRIVSSSGNVLSSGERGELQVRGVTIFKKYWNKPDATKKTFDSNSWMKTGDVALIDHLGYVYIVDRIKDMVIRGGENIGCGAVEHAIDSHPSVVEVSVYAIPDERLGEEVGATVYTKDGLTEKVLREYLVDKLAKFEIPRYFRFITSPPPRTGSGKILKKELKQIHMKLLQQKHKSKL